MSDSRKRKRDTKDDPEERERMRKIQKLTKMFPKKRTEVFRMADMGPTFFQVASSTSTSDYYSIVFRVSDGIPRFACSCGIPYGEPERNQCKHIGRLIAHLMRTFVNQYVDGDAMENEEMVEMFMRLTI